MLMNRSEQTNYRTQRFLYLVGSRFSHKTDRQINRIKIALKKSTLYLKKDPRFENLFWLKSSFCSDSFEVCSFLMFQGINASIAFFNFWLCKDWVFLGLFFVRGLDSLGNLIHHIYLCRNYSLEEVYIKCCLF